MGFFSRLFGKNEQTSGLETDIDLSGEQVKHIVETLAYGESDDIASLLFGNDSLTDRDRKIPLGLLDQLRAPKSAMAISVAEAGYQRQFWMLILEVPWLMDERAGPYQPLLLAHQGTSYKVAGFVLPWNEIIPMFTEDQMDGAARLTAWYAIWLKEKRSSQ